MSIEIRNRWTSAVIFNHNVEGATMRDAVRAALVADADLSGANLRDADLSGASVPVVADLDRKMLEAVSKPGALDMGTWHSCSTTHCRAGWAITLAGKEGLELEARLGPAVAGALIYSASTGRRVPDFYATDEAAMEDIKRCAELPAPVAPGT